MLSIDSKMFKQVAEKFAGEIHEKYCPETKIKHSFALEALSHAFGYKDYNTIKPELDTQIGLINSLSELINQGYVDITYEPIPIHKLTKTAQREFVKHLFNQLAFLYRSALSLDIQKWYLLINIDEYKDYKTIIHAVSVCLGIRINYFEVDRKTVALYLQYGEVDYKVGLIRSKLEKNTCMQLFNKGTRATQCVFKGFSEKGIIVYLFDENEGILTQNEISFQIDEKVYLTYENDLQMRMASALINDATNEDFFNYAIFSRSYHGMIRARYVVQEHPDVAMYVLKNIYGCSPDSL